MKVGGVQEESLFVVQCDVTADTGDVGSICISLQLFSAVSTCSLIGMQYVTCTRPRRSIHSRLYASCEHPRPSRQHPHPHQHRQDGSG